ncbi:TetR/AcrR family transcriptional regulator [soil metagenome]
MEPRLNKQAWLDAGLQTLANEGPDGLKIMGIAQALGVTKGSFYWHFADLQTFKSAVLAEWEQKSTDDIITLVEQAGGDVESKARMLMHATLRTRSTLGRAIRAWAHTDVTVREAQKRVDQKRLNYVAGLMREIGWPAKDAAALSRWVYYAVIGYNMTDGPLITPREMDLYLTTLMLRK